VPAHAGSISNWEKPMTKSILSCALLACLLASVPAIAGPPLICQPIDIGNAKSLPWRMVNGWDGTDRSYDTARLMGDMLALLAPGAPLNLRMETMRRAALYAAKDERLASDLTNRLLARTLDAEASGKADPQAWFDAGYFVETLRQATFIYRYDMLSPEERKAWQLRGAGSPLDGYPWVEKAIRMGGRGMEQALSRMGEYRKADAEARARQSVAAKQ
jgi:hypothetical protein